MGFNSISSTGNTVPSGNILKYILLAIREPSFFLIPKGVWGGGVGGVGGVGRGCLGWEKVCLTVSAGIWDVLEHSQCNWCALKMETFTAGSWDSQESVSSMDCHKLHSSNSSQCQTPGSEGKPGTPTGIHSPSDATLLSHPPKPPVFESKIIKAVTDFFPHWMVQTSPHTSCTYSTHTHQLQRAMVSWDVVSPYTALSTFHC